MSPKPARFLGLFALNVLAAYIPSLIWMAAIQPDNTFAYLCSPVIAVILWVWTLSHAIMLTILGCYQIILLGISFLFHESRAKWVIPIIVFAFGFAQGIFSVKLIDGINAIGHT
jgi:hypothetical protein